MIDDERWSFLYFADRGVGARIISLNELRWVQSGCLSMIRMSLW